MNRISFIGVLVALVLIQGTLQPDTAHAEWVTAETPLRMEPAVKLVPFDDGLLALQAKRLLVITDERESARQSFTLRTQTDAFVDVFVAAERWILASRRSIWSSDDRGHSWRMLVTLTARDPNEWMAVWEQDGVLIAVSREGMRSVAPGRATAWGRFGRSPIENAVSKEDSLAIHVPAGVYVYGRDELERLPIRGGDGLTAFYPGRTTTVVATGLDVQFCDGHCASVGTLPGVSSLAVSSEGYWAATSDAVWFRPADNATWTLRREGLSHARPGAVAVREDHVWLLSHQGLHLWQERDLLPESPPDSIHPLADLRRGPPMRDVRRMVMNALNLHPPTVTSWRERARWRAAAPRLALTLRRDDDERAGQSISNTLGISTTENRIILGPEGSSTNRTSRQGFHYGMVATWQLDNLVFNREEVLVSDRMISLHRRKESVILDATRIYFDRLRTLAELSTTEERERIIELELRLAELTADLDFYTNGGFSAALERERGSIR